MKPMLTSNRGLCLLMTGGLMFAASTQLWAADNSREREALRRAQQSLHQAQEERDTLATDKAALTQDKTRLESELKQTAAKVQGSERQAVGLKARVKQLEASLAEQQKAVADGQAREAALTEQLRQTEAKLQDQVRVARTVQSMLEQRAKEAQTLSTQNQAMYQVGLDAIDLYKARSPSAFLQARDKLLGWESIRAENVAETLRDRLDEARFNPPPAAGPLTSTAKP